jgi:hypothetical protein
VRMRLGNGGRALAAHVGVVLIRVCVDILLMDFIANLTARREIMAAIVATCGPVRRLGISIRATEIYIAGQLARRGSNGANIGKILFCGDRGWHRGQMI